MSNLGSVSLLFVMKGTNGFQKQGTDGIATAENGTCKDCEELGLEDLRDVPAGESRYKLETIETGHKYGPILQEWGSYLAHSCLI
ncbi:unnamed protein product [Sphagnum troendelagicum]